MTEAMTSDIKAAEKIAYDLLGGPEAGLTVAEAEAGVRRLLNDSERRARDILNSHEGQLHRLAAALLEHGTLEAIDVADHSRGPHRDQDRQQLMACPEAREAVFLGIALRSFPALSTESAPRGPRE